MPVPIPVCGPDEEKSQQERRRRVADGGGGAVGQNTKIVRTMSVRADRPVLLLRPPCGEKGGRGFPLDANAATNNYP